MSGAFRDPDGDELKFAVESSDDQVATVCFRSRAGSTTITVTAAGRTKRYTDV